MLYLIKHCVYGPPASALVDRLGGGIMGRFEDDVRGPCILFTIPERELSLDECELFRAAFEESSGVLAGIASVRVVPTHYEGIMALEYEEETPPVPEGEETPLVPEGEELLQARKAYIAWMASHNSARLWQLRDQQTEERQRVDTYRSRLTEALRRMAFLNVEVNAVANLSTDQQARYGPEFDKIVKHSKVKTVRFVDGLLHVLTDDLFVYNEGDRTWHHLGQFDITLANNGRLGFDNLTQQVNGYSERMNAPHVFAGGNACYGNLEEVIPSLLADGEYASIIFMGIAFLESVNTLDVAGAYVCRWPVVSEEVAKGKRPIEPYLRDAWSGDEDEDEDEEPENDDEEPENDDEGDDDE